MLRGYAELRKRDKVAATHSYKVPAGGTDENHQIAMIKGRAELKEASARFSLGQVVRTSAGTGKIIEISANGSISIRTSRGLRKVVSPHNILD